MTTQADPAHFYTMEAGTELFAVLGPYQCQRDAAVQRYNAAAEQWMPCPNSKDLFGAQPQPAYAISAVAFVSSLERCEVRTRLEMPCLPVTETVKT